LRSLRPHHALELRQLDAEHFAVEKEERRERLILGRSSNPGIDSKSSQEYRDLVRAKLPRVGSAMKGEIATNPTLISFLCSRTHMPQADRSQEGSVQTRMLPGREVLTDHTYSVENAGVIGC
jgi:hypothetical protein